ncbi:MAG TPA: hypothetical protein PLO20_15355, partial [Thermogutta sp.]|nr:hypothetical protein [Thermogutta sp.]
MRIGISISISGEHHHAAFDVSVLKHDWECETNCVFSQKHKSLIENNLRSEHVLHGRSGIGCAPSLIRQNGTRGCGRF